jgi:hypothetical protein
MPQTYLIITTCIKNKMGIQYGDRRKQEYYIGIANVLNLLPPSIKPIIVENSQDNKSYLDVFNCDIVYTNNNDYVIEDGYTMHKGYREMIDIQHIIKKYDIHDEDMIIKMTGRYQLFKDDFFNIVLQNLDKKAIFREFNVMTYSKNPIDIVLGLFAVQSKYLKDFQYKNHSVGCEEEYRTYINENICTDDILKVDRLYLRCIIGDTFRLIDT